MPTRFLQRGASLPALATATTLPPNVGAIGFDSATDTLKYNSAGLTVRTVVNTDEAQTLTNKSIQPIVQAIAANGAATIQAGSAFITKSSAGATITLADPTATTHDGFVMRFVSTTAQAHTVSNAAGSGFNNGGAASDVATFGGAAGDNFEIVAYQGKWYVIELRNVTLG